MSEPAFINLTNAQMESIYALQEKSYVYSQQLICAHAKKDLKLVGKYSKLSCRSHRAHSEFILEIIRKHCGFSEKKLPCHHEVDETGRRLVLSWSCFENHDER
jgi:hypothetical protein